MLDRYLTRIAFRCLAERGEKVAALRTPAEVGKRQEYIRAKVAEAVGGWPDKTPLNARVTGAFERDGYRVEKLIYESLPRFFVTANVYVPKSGRPPYPAILGVAGHSANGKAQALYQHVWISLAKRGVLVLAYDPPGQGERSEYFDAALGRSTVGIGTTEHTMAGIQCLLTGTNIARYEIWDGVRGFDYLLTRGDVDPRRIGVAGNSGGGTQSAYLAVAERRLAVAAPSCYITSWEKLWTKPGPQDAEQNFVNFIRDGLDFGDFLIAFAPRPILMSTAIRDYFPIEGARSTYAEARRVFEAAGAAGRAGYFEYDDTHGWSKPRREAAYAWIERWLLDRSESAPEPDFDTEPEANLYATSTGQVRTSMKGAETVQSLNLALANHLHAQRARRKPEDVAARLVLERAAGVPPVTRLGVTQHSGYRVEKLSLRVEEGIDIPALAFVPEGGAAKKPAVLWINAAGKSADAGGDLDELARLDHIALAIDPRGWGETSGKAGPSGGYGAAYQTAMRALLVGQTLAGMQTRDALAAFEYLASRADVDAARLSAFGKGNGGVIALYAAALEPRIRKLALERSVLSYMAIARARQHEGIFDIVVPGVLRDFDLPDLAASIAPRPVWLVDPRTPAGGRVAPETARLEYPAAAHVLERAEGWPFAKVYAKWLE